MQGVRQMFCYSFIKVGVSKTERVYVLCVASCDLLLNILVPGRPC